MICKELERAGIPTVQWCNMIPVAKAIGVNRIMESPSIKYPFGAPELKPDQEKEARVKMLRKALEGLTKNP